MTRLLVSLAIMLVGCAKGEVKIQKRGGFAPLSSQVRAGKGVGATRTGPRYFYHFTIIDFESPEAQNVCLRNQNRQVCLEVEKKKK